MSETVIKVENLSKQYRLGTVGTGSLSHDVNRLWYKVRGKEDPYLKIGEENDRTAKGNSEYVWALRDVNFKVNHGEVLGIIGRNGAGKSTLLKILSRTTKPTTGTIGIKGRVASLLEVGTGFHPELSGRENIFLNGAILGMTKTEIKRKFDEIVDFAGVEKYIDTPVKRYSSGMYVRLAFGVAAHLEPEILIVDEVLAVGDAEFQRKALGKMNDVSKSEGRTILFVSHNMAAMKQLCQRGILMQHGQVLADGRMNEIADQYLIAGVTQSNESVWTDDEAPGNDKITIRKVSAAVSGRPATEPIKTSDDIDVMIEFENHQKNIDLDVTWDIYDVDLVHVCHIGTLVGSGDKIDSGKFRVVFTIPKHLLNTKRYTFNVIFGADQKHLVYHHEGILSIDVEDGLQRQGNSFHQYPGVIHPKVTWQKTKISELVVA
ncbi:MAG TPA: ABC transporter ATP-binding protein [Flavipsychrobacter sp.]|nr:ABC transporter ATP-binding protein [Flavipsychrobacter sp.]